MSRFNFGNRRNDGSSEREKYEREVYFTKSQHDREPYPDEFGFSTEHLRGGHEREDNYRQYPPHQQDHPYLRGQAEHHPQGPGARQQGSQQLRGSGRQSHPDELKALSFWKPQEDDLHDDPENWSDKSSPLKFVVAISGIVVFSAIAWFSYRWIGEPGSDTPPLIQAESGPFKVRPENPGGLSIPHQDKLIYGRMSGGEEQPVERLLPPPEQPAVMAPQGAYAYPAQPGQYPQPPAVQGQPQQQPGGGYPPGPQQPYEQAAPGYPPQQPAPATYQAAPYPPQQGLAPVNQYPQQYSGQNQGQQNQAYLQQAQGVPVYQGQQPPQAQQQQVIPAQQQNQAQQAYSAGYVPAPPAPNQSQPAREPLDKPAAKEQKKAEAAPIQGAAFFVQLGTLPTEQLAQLEADRLTKKYKGDLQGLDVTVRPLEAPDGNKTFRVITGPFKTRNGALGKSAKLGSGSRVVQLQN